MQTTGKPQSSGFCIILRHYTYAWENKSYSSKAYMQGKSVILA